MNVVDFSIGLNRRFQITLNSQEVAVESQSILDKIRDTTMVGGRPRGEASPELVARLFGNQAKATATENLLNRALSTLVDQMGISADAAPLIEKECRPSPTKRYTGILNEYGDYGIFVGWTAEAQPELKDYLGVEVRIRTGNRDAAIDGQLKILQARSSTNSKVDRAAIDSDTLMVDICVTKEDGTEIKGGKFDGFVFCPKFKDTTYFGVEINTLSLGVSVGESFSYPHTFSAKHPDQYLRGLSGTVTVKMLEVNEAIVPTIDDQFAVAVGHADLAALRESIGVLWDTNEERKAQESLTKEFRAALLAANPIPVDEAKVKSYFKSMLEEMEISAEVLETEKLAEAKAGLMKEAEQMIRLTRIFRIIRDLHPQETRMTEEFLLVEAGKNGKNGTTPEQELASLRGNLHYNNWLTRMQLKKTEQWLLSQVKIVIEESE
jgi:trigger factor